MANAIKYSKAAYGQHKMPYHSVNARWFSPLVDETPPPNGLELLLPPRPTSTASSPASAGPPIPMPLILLLLALLGKRGSPAFASEASREGADGRRRSCAEREA